MYKNLVSGGFLSLRLTMKLKSVLFSFHEQGQEHNQVYAEKKLI